ncbi:hypothetical protein [Longimycelium tulufanense]|uniref:hypothetical protein n=1 Tax=Longimycelium tulufanense TaxID=907463 RepID=UPI00166886AF|nr:hypothetical protein [Longimycelium tulufanense]
MTLRYAVCARSPTVASKAQHHCDADPSAKTLKIWERWLDKVDQIFARTYKLTGDDYLLLEGILVEAALQSGWS